MVINKPVASSSLIMNTRIFRSILLIISVMIVTSSFVAYAQNKNKSDIGSIVRELVMSLSSRDAKERSTAGWKLINLGEPAIPYLINSLHSSSTNKAGLAIVFKNIGKPAYSHLITAALDKRIEKDIMRTFREIGEPIVPYIFTALEGKEVSHVVAMTILANVGEPAVPYLLTALAAEKNIQFFAQNTLILIGEPALPYIIKEVRSDTNPGFIMSWIILKGIGQPALPYLKSINNDASV